MRSIVPVICFLLAIDLNAQELPEIDTDRPDQTESSSVLPAGTVQFEVGVQNEGDGYETTLSLPAMLVRFGALDWLELRVIAERWNFDWSRDILYDPPPTENGWTFGGGAKIQLAREDGLMPEIALLAHLTKSSFTGDSGSADPLPEFRFSMGHALPGGLDLGYNLGAEWLAAFDQLAPVYTLALGFPIVESVGGYAEIFGDYDPLWRELNSSLDAGITYSPQNNLQLDISAGGGIAGPASGTAYAGAGISYRFPY